MATKEQDEAAIFAVRKAAHKATKCLEEAMSLDEKKDHIHAISKYEQGLKYLEQGINVDLSEKGKEWDKARGLAEKLKNNHADITVRVEELKLQSKSSNSPKSCPKQRHKKAEQQHQQQHKQRKNKPVQEHKGMNLEVASQHKPQAKDKAKQPLNALKNVKPELAHAILNDVLVSGDPIKLEDVVGLEKAKQFLYEIFVLPALRPDLFQGLRQPPKTLLMFGPPGNGKTLLAKAAAHEAKATFFNITASSLTSKYVGESEKLVVALFAVAQELAPSIIFIDEIDSLMSARTSGEQEHSRRLKTQLLCQMDGAIGGDAHVVVLAATNLPMDLDSAFIRRFNRKLYVTLPDDNARAALISKLLLKVPNKLAEKDLRHVVKMTEGYSMSDLTQVIKEAALEPLRELGQRIVEVEADDVRPVATRDFEQAIKSVRPSVTKEVLDSLNKYCEECGIAY